MDRQVPVGYAAALLASFLFGWAITPSRGAYSDPAMTMVLLATIVVGWRYVVNFGGRVDQIPARVLAPLVWGCAIAMAFTAYNDAEIIIYPVKFWETGRKAQGWSLIALLAYLPSMLKWPEPRWARHLRFVFIAGCITLAGVDTYRTSPTPRIDVWTVQQQGAAFFFEGKNPFQEVHAGDTGPRTANDVPYVYPPMQLYVTSIAWKLTNDVRFAILAAAILLGFSVRAIGTRFGAKALPAILEDAPALFIWFTPKFFFILEQAWVDPVQIFWCSALILVAAMNRPWATAVLVGLVVGAKQTMLLFAGLIGLGLRFNWRQWVLAGSVSLATFLPWMIWDFKAWKFSNFDFLSALPVRPDALTYITWVRRKFNVEIPYLIAFPAAFALAGLAAWRLRKGLGPLTMAAVASMTVLFVFNKWAFANYYFTLLGLSCIAAAAALGDTAPEPAPSKDAAA
ncbi:MAG: hypothetical protein Q8K32_27680 [Archangium sp.]|nr:hypothetical protein [Archangium sp.]